MTARIIRGPWQGGGILGLGTPPTAAYLLERIRLGMPSHAQSSTITCPWCDAAPFDACRNRITGQRLRDPHDARQP